METQIYFKSVKKLLQTDNFGLFIREILEWNSSEALPHISDAGTLNCFILAVFMIGSPLSLHKAFLQAREIKPQKKKI